MPKLMRRTVISGALEATRGTAPSSGYSAVLVNEGAEISPEANQVQRQTVKATFSPTGSVIGQKRWTMNLPVELKGGGSNAGVIVEPEISWLLQCCGMNKEDGLYVPVSSVTGVFQPGELIKDATTTIGTLVAVEDSDGDGTLDTLFIRDKQNPIAGSTLTGNTSAATATAGTDVDALVYRPVTNRTSLKTAAVRFGLDGIRHVCTYTRGSMSINVGVGSYGVCTFNLQGIFNAPTDTPNPSANYNATIPPVAVNAGLAIGAWDMTTTATTQLQVDLANTIAVRNDFGALDGVAGTEITGRGTNGSIDPEVTSIGQYDIWTQWKEATPQTIFATFGASGGDGERVHLLMPKCQYQNVSYQDRDGISAYQLPFACQGGNEDSGGTGGDDEIYLIFY